MLNFTEDDFEAELSSVNYGLYEEMPMTDYRAADGLANSELQVFERNHASYIWNKEAPTDPLKVTSSDFGTALHSSLLEPETYESTIKVSDVKGRTAGAFLALQQQYKSKIVLTEIEYDQIALMTESASCDPMFKKALDAHGVCEASIFVTDPTTGVDCKIRPDKIIIEPENKMPVLCDVKSSADLDEWRQDKQWLNPLFKFNYGFTAAYYIHVASIYYQMEIDKYVFLVVSKSASMGKYPVSVFIITKDELIQYGFWKRMLDSLEDFSKCKSSKDFLTYEKFPEFYMYEDENVEVTFEED